MSRSGPARLRTVARADDGQVMLLTIGFAVVALALVLTLSAVSGLLLERKRLMTLADGAAAYAASSFDVEAMYGEMTGDGFASLPRRTDREVAELVTEHLERSAGGGAAGGDVELVGTSSDDGAVTVTLARRVQPALLRLVADALGYDGVEVVAHGAARPRF